MKIKRDPLDRLFSRYIRMRDKWTCQRCGKTHAENSQGLHCSHFWGRANLGTRWDDANCVALCYGCHAYFTSRPQEHRDWYRQKIGGRAFDLLQMRARRVTRFNAAERKLLKADIQARLEALG